MDELQDLKIAAHKVFSAMDVDDRKQVKYEGFAKAVSEAPWIADLVGITSAKLKGPKELRDAAILEVFQKVDYTSDGCVDVEELVEFLRGELHDNLPGVLRALKQKKFTATPISD